MQNIIPNKKGGKNYFQYNQTWWMAAATFQCLKPLYHHNHSRYHDNKFCNMTQSAALNIRSFENARWLQLPF